MNIKALQRFAWSAPESPGELSCRLGFSLARIDWSDACDIDVMNTTRKSFEAVVMAEGPRCPINVAARRAGLTAHVIRAWERRYSAITPQRTGKGRRLYSDWEVQRLVLLRQAVEFGHRISEIAALPVDELRNLVGQDTLPGVEASPRIPITTGRLLQLAHEMVRALDTQGMSQLLLQATRSLSVPELFDDFVLPLKHEVVAFRRNGQLQGAHEHFVQVHLRRFVSELLTAHSTRPSASTVLVCGSLVQRQETPVLVSAATVGREGWQVLCLGAGVESGDIAYAALRRNVSAVVISLSSDADQRERDDLIRLRSRLPQSLPVIIVGRPGDDGLDKLHPSTG